MREIKFRGWHIVDGWVYGYYAVDDNGNHLIYGIDPDDGSWGAWIVEPDSVGQYTGLKDRNGKEIHEGDIVKAIARYVTSDILLLAECKTKEIVGVVEWDEGGWWCLKTQDEYLPKVGFYAVEEFVDVLGNVYENPELHAEI